jgi:hypothetical protein
MSARSLLITLALALSALASSVLGHELDDGFVERAVQIVIRDDQATIKYSFGLTEPTMVQLVDSWAADGRPEDSGGPGESDRPANPSYVSGSPPTPDGPNLAAELTMTPQFANHVLDHLAGALQISADGQPLMVETVSLEPSPRHHYRYIAHFKFRLPPSKSCKLSIQDNNFPQFDGAARYALKALGATMIMKSNVMPVVVRAQRHVLPKDVLEKRGEICKIDAVVSTTRSIPDSGR